MSEEAPNADVMIRMRNIRVDYGDVAAVRDLDLDIARGEVYGLIGPNGAGKSSAIRVLATLQEPTHGRVWINGHDTVERLAQVRRITGYMPDLAPVYTDLKCWEFLDLFGAAYFVSRSQRRRRVDECLEAVGLMGKRNVLAGTLSRGMTQRLVLAKTILTDPQALLLDEPASGLDPIARIQLRDLLRRLAGEGKTIVISSHILTELSEFCTSVGVMQKGELILHGSIEDAVRNLGRAMEIEVRLSDTLDDAVARLQAYDDVSAVETTASGFALRFDGDHRRAAQLLAALVRDGIPVCGFAERKLSIEDVLLDVGAREVS